MKIEISSIELAKLIEWGQYKQSSFSTQSDKKLLTRLYGLDSVNAKTENEFTHSLYQKKYTVAEQLTALELRLDRLEERINYLDKDAE